MKRRVIMPALFQLYKTALISYLQSFRVAMPSRRRPLAPAHTLDEQYTRMAPELDPCPCEIVNLVFDPNPVLLRRVFILNDNIQNMSVGFYPVQKNQPLVDFGVSKRLPSYSGWVCRNVGRTTAESRGSNVSGGIISVHVRGQSL